MLISRSRGRGTFLLLQPLIVLIPGSGMAGPVSSGGKGLPRWKRVWQPGVGFNGGGRGLLASPGGGLGGVEGVLALLALFPRVVFAGER